MKNHDGTNPHKYVVWKTLKMKDAREKKGSALDDTFLLFELFRVRYNHEIRCKIIWHKSIARERKKPSSKK